jgi:hypothetical protein
MSEVVSDASPLIVLARAKLLDAAPRIFTVPRAALDNPLG